jgi:hypothetical protein
MSTEDPYSCSVARWVVEDSVAAGVCHVEPPHAVDLDIDGFSQGFGVHRGVCAGSKAALLTVDPYSCGVSRWVVEHSVAAEVCHVEPLHAVQVHTEGAIEGFGVRRDVCVGSKAALLTVDPFSCSVARSIVEDSVVAVVCYVEPPHAVQHHTNWIAEGLGIHSGVCFGSKAALLTVDPFSCSVARSIVEDPVVVGVCYVEPACAVHCNTIGRIEGIGIHGGCAAAGKTAVLTIDPCSCGIVRRVVEDPVVAGVTYVEPPRGSVDGQKPGIVEALGIC